MPIKKSEIYSSLWASCDELRGGMDASQYKDYVLAFLFIKYVSDKYANQKYAGIRVPEGASFSDMVQLKGNTDIGDQINKRIIAPLVANNPTLSQSDFPDFNDANKLGNGKEMQDRLSNLIGIFEESALDFSKNRAGDDDLLGDAYEYLMRNFATESGKSKGQFYTPSEVSRLIAQVIGIRQDHPTNETAVYDPTCGSGSLLLKVADEAGVTVTLNGQEKDATTSGLARMNMILHNYPTAIVMQGNTLTEPKFMENGTLKTFDYVVANPPFSDKRWSSGLDPLKDPFERFKPYGIPPNKQGDYAYLLHIIRSLKSTGKGACILPHGVLFRGNSEAEIRKALIQRRYIKGIIGLPPNLFYGTGIPACIVVVDKRDAHSREGIFMIDASHGFLKDGAKNRLRDQDIHKIVDAFSKFLEIPKYSKMVSFEEIEKNDFNLNLPRYIDSSEPEDLQDIDGHLNGGIPSRDIDSLQPYWDVCPNLRSVLFKPLRPNYYELAIPASEIKKTIAEHSEFKEFVAEMELRFEQWRRENTEILMNLQPGFHPKELILILSESLLNHFDASPLIDRYDIYQILMDYWVQIMQDDCYLLAVDGWKAETHRILKKDKKGQAKDKGWTCDLIPKPLIVARYYAEEQKIIDGLTVNLENISAQLAELEEENSGEEGIFSDFDKIFMQSVSARLKEYSKDKEAKEETNILNEWLKLNNQINNLKAKLKMATTNLDIKAYDQYPKLQINEIKTLLIEEKWYLALSNLIHYKNDQLKQQLTEHVKDLVECYRTPLSQISENVKELEIKVSLHIKRMGF